MKVVRNYIVTEEDGKFLRWFINCLTEAGLTQSNVAKKIGVTRQAVNMMCRKKYKPQKQTVIALCWAFGMKDDPEEVWKLVEEDWA